MMNALSLKHPLIFASLCLWGVLCVFSPSLYAHNGMQHRQETHLMVHGHDVLVELLSPARYQQRTGLTPPPGSQVLWLQVLRQRRPIHGWTASVRVGSIKKELQWRTSSRFPGQNHYATGLSLLPRSRHQLSLDLRYRKLQYLKTLSVFAP